MEEKNPKTKTGKQSKPKKKKPKTWDKLFDKKKNKKKMLKEMDKNSTPGNIQKPFTKKQKKLGGGGTKTGAIFKSRGTGGNGKKKGVFLDPLGKTPKLQKKKNPGGKKKKRTKRKKPGGTTIKVTVPPPPNCHQPKRRQKVFVCSEHQTTRWGDTQPKERGEKQPLAVP